MTADSFCRLAIAVSTCPAEQLKLVDSSSDLPGNFRRRSGFVVLCIARQVSRASEILCLVSGGNAMAQIDLVSFAFALYHRKMICTVREGRQQM